MKTSSSTLFSYIHTLATQLERRYSDPVTATAYAWWILEAVTNKSHAQLIAQSTFQLSDQQQETIHKWITQIVKEAMPLAYVIGWVPFNDLTLEVRPPVLIPRPETEEWITRLITLLHSFKYDSLSILDMGTGSGCIALAIAHAFPQFHIVGTDVSDEALQLAAHNAKKNNISTVEWIKSSLFDSIPASYLFDLIISNPPYIDRAEEPFLDESVRKWEDPGALYAANNGLAIIEQLLIQSPLHLKQKSKLQSYSSIAQLYIEIGHQQKEQTLALCSQYKYGECKVWYDMAGKPRVLEARVSSYVETSSS